MGLFKRYCPYGCGRELGFCRCAQGDARAATKQKQVRNGRPTPRGKRK